MAGGEKGADGPMDGADWGRRLLCVQSAWPDIPDACPACGTSAEPGSPRTPVRARRAFAPPESGMRRPGVRSPHTNLGNWSAALRGMRLSGAPAARRRADPCAVLDDDAAAAYRVAVRALCLSLRTAAAPRPAPPPVEIGPSLGAKASSDGTYRKFVDTVVDACRSPRATRLGVTRCAMEEKRDLESPDWITVTLAVWLSDRDFDAKMDAWSEIRDIVDARTAPLREGAHADGMRDIYGRFFISLGR